MADLLPLVNKTVPFKFRGAELRLDLSHALFSSFDVDAGTRLLLKAVGRDEVLLGAKRVLDSGCGVGVIGLAVAAALPECHVEARDRDLLACAFTERNRKRNKVANLAVRPGLLSVATPGLLGTGEAEAPYDYILSNLPAKAGAPVLEAFFVAASALLLPGGRLGVVIVNPLMDEARAWIAKAGLAVLAEERGANHHVYVCGKGTGPTSPQAAAATAAKAEPPAVESPPAPASDEAPPVQGPFLDFSGLDLAIYLRRRGAFKLGGTAYEASGIWGLPEFDTVGYGPVAAAELAVRVLPGSLVRDALVVNPGIGHLALWMARRLGPERIMGASRDLLSLAATGANLASQPRPRPDYRALSSLELSTLEAASLDLIAWAPDIVPEYDWIAPLWDEAARLLKAGATLIVHCPPTELTRLSKRKPQGFRLLGEKKKRSFAAAAWMRS
jgi:hypothetical protein